MLVIYKIRSIQIKIAVYCCLSGGIHIWFVPYSKACIMGGAGIHSVHPHISGVHGMGKGVEVSEPHTKLKITP